MAREDRSGRRRAEPELVRRHCPDRTARAAERCGETAAALEWHQAVPMFGRGRHRGVLDRLVRLGEDLPPWVWARWIVYQAIRCEDERTETGRLQRRVLRYAVESIHSADLSDCHESGGDPVRVSSRVFGESWAFHQIFCHELGGLASFLDELVTGRLAEHADLARSWVGTPLGGYRVGASLPGHRLRVQDAASGAAVDVLDLGARAGAGPEGWVVGRLVPSGIDDLLMFDVPPLAVSERIAREVAGVTEAARRWPRAGRTPTMV